MLILEAYDKRLHLIRPHEMQSHVVEEEKVKLRGRSRSVPEAKRPWRFRVLRGSVLLTCIPEQQ